LPTRRRAGQEAFLKGFADPDKARTWLADWRERLTPEARPVGELAAALRAVNPAVIPRNHKVQEALSAANYGDFSFFERLLEALEKPFEERPEFVSYMQPPKPEERVTQTFCGT
jgi:uncharacterized protein YdiU (UPF0061 family)